ncbi:MAG: hypothetical protein AAGA54_21710 [Myxococcota bacterium]
MAAGSAKARLTEEARWLLSAYDPEFEELAGADVPYVERAGSRSIRLRGEYQRWMQDARGWGVAASRVYDESDDPYREGERLRVDRALKDAASAVIEGVTKQTPATIRAALAAYVQGC